jgi:hypothetical protein
MNDVSLLSKLREQQDHGVALRTMLADLAGDAGRRRLMCPAPPAPPPPPPVPSEDRRLAEERGGHSGKLQIVLRWGDRSDLDLHVVCPSGEEIKYDHKAACGGALDVDANGTASQAISNPVENASFPDPAPGRYKIVVIPFEIRPVGAPQTTFRVTVVREGQADEVINGVAPAGPVTQGKTHPGPPQTVTTIEIPAP